MITGREHMNQGDTMAYVIIVEFRAKPDQVAAFAEPIDRHAYNSHTLEDGCLAFNVCEDPKDSARFVLYEAYRDHAAHARHLKMDSYKWFREKAPALIVPGSERPPPSADGPTVFTRLD